MYVFLHLPILSFIFGLGALYALSLKSTAFGFALFRFRIADKLTFEFRGGHVQFESTFGGLRSQARHILCASWVKVGRRRPQQRLQSGLLSISCSRALAEILETHSQLAASQKYVALSSLLSPRAPHPQASCTTGSYTHQRYYNYFVFSAYSSYSWAFKAIHYPSIAYTIAIPFLQPTTEVDFSSPTVWCPRA